MYCAHSLTRLQSARARTWRPRAARSRARRCSAVPSPRLPARCVPSASGFCCVVVFCCLRRRDGRAGCEPRFFFWLARWVPPFSGRLSDGSLGAVGGEGGGDSSRLARALPCRGGAGDLVAGNARYFVAAAAAGAACPGRGRAGGGLAHCFGWPARSCCGLPRGQRFWRYLCARARLGGCSCGAD
eukprot:SAG22_NODE_29_length_28404_cov_23.294153_15_plen_185_part_00